MRLAAFAAVFFMCWRACWRARLPSGAFVVDCGVGGLPGGVLARCAARGASDCSLARRLCWPSRWCVNRLTSGWGASCGLSLVDPLVEVQCPLMSEDHVSFGGSVGMVGSMATRRAAAHGLFAHALVCRFLRPARSVGVRRYAGCSSGQQVRGLDPCVFRAGAWPKIVECTLLNCTVDVGASQPIVQPSCMTFLLYEWWIVFVFSVGGCGCISARYSNCTRRPSRRKGGMEGRGFADPGSAWIPAHVGGGCVDLRWAALAYTLDRRGARAATLDGPRGSA